MPGRLEFDFPLPRPGSKPMIRAESERPMRIALLADFAGRPSARSQRPVSVDVDRFAEVLRRFAPRLELPLTGDEGPTTEIAFESLEDFAPDRLLENLALFQELRRTRERLSDPSTFQTSADELRREAAGAAAPENDDATVARLLGSVRSDPAAGRGRVAADGVDRLIRRIVAPYVVPSADPRQALYVAAVDAAIADRMRSVLHHPRFQQLEAAWRWVDRLVRRLELGQELELWLLDVRRDELLDDLDRSEGGPASSQLAAALDASGTGESPWSMVVADLEFGPAARDLRLLAFLGAVAATAGGPLLAAASPRLLGCGSLADSPDPAAWDGLSPDADAGWQALRGSPVARWIGLALPRILMRLPYGRETEATESFEFEELPPARPHAAYLWGSPAVACAELLAATFAEQGWSMEPGDLTQLEDLPAHSFREEGESRMQACAEVFLTDRAAQTVATNGIMPWMSYRNRDAARLLQFRSIADPPVPLAGPWS